MISKLSTTLFVIATTLGICQAAFVCDENNDYTNAHCYEHTCLNSITTHIEKEFDASFTYLMLGAFFDQSSNDHRGLANFFYKSASEERQHAIMMLDYLDGRGYAFNENFNYKFSKVKHLVRKNLGIGYKQALEKALKMEIQVTDAIQAILRNCNDDFHAQDKFTDPVMDEQHRGIRKLQGAIKQLDNMRATIQEDNVLEMQLTEYMIDQKILNGQVLG